jgi:hypothetical protein
VFGNVKQQPYAGQELLEILTIEVGACVDPACWHITTKPCVIHAHPENNNKARSTVADTIGLPGTLIDRDGNTGTVLNFPV